MNKACVFLIRKQYKFFKQAVLSILALMLLTATLFGITAAAESEGFAEGIAPRIVIKNLSYSSYLHIFYAIPVESFPEGSILEVDFYIFLIYTIYLLTTRALCVIII